MSDPSLLVTRPAQTDPSLAFSRDGRIREPLSVLAPCPNLDSASLDWSTLGPPYVREIILTLQERGYRGLVEGFEIDHVDTPPDLAREGHGRG